MPINPNDSIQIILKTFPEYVHHWVKHVNEWTLDDRPFGIDIASFSAFACDIIITGNEILLEKIIDLTEDMVSNGDEKVRNAFKYEFLENITNRANEIPIERLTKHLKENSKKICLDLDLLWGTQTPGLT
jgi:hypothetical protein